MKRRLNPFAFPSETDFRFVLLIVLIVSVCLSNFYILIQTTPSSFQRSYFATLEDCFSRFLPEPGPSPELSLATGLEDFTARLEQESARYAPARECTQPVSNKLILGIFAATAGVLLVAALIFWLSPRWTIRRHRLSPITADDVPEVTAYLDSLGREMGLPRRPRFLWNPLNATRSAFTFGNLSHQYVAMSMGLVSQFYSDRAAFRAVLLHELSHLKNADLAKTQFATALWVAFLACVALPGLFFSLFARQPGSGFGLLAWSRMWQLILLTGLVYYVRNGILRVREYYADVRASEYEVDPAALERVLMDAPPEKTSRRLRPFATHPPPATRAGVLNDPRGLFFATFGVAAVTGAVMGIIYSTNDLWATSLGQRFFGQNSALSLLLAVLLIGTVGLSIWRGTAANLLEPPRPRRIGRVSLGVGLGLFLGAQVIDMAGTLDFLGTADLTSILSLQLFLAAWALFGAAITFIAGLWSITCATAWSEFAAGRRAPRMAYLVWFLVASGVTAILVYPLSISYSMGQGLYLGGLIILGAIPTYLITPAPGASIAKSVLFIGIWALPLAAWLFRRRFRPIRQASWGYLKPVRVTDVETAGPQPQASEPERLVFSIPLAVKSALVFAAMFLVVLALKWIVRFGRGVQPGPAADYNDLFGEIILGTAILLQVVLAVWIVVRTRQFRISHALFASFILAVLMSIANNLINGIVETGSPFPTPRYYWDDLHVFWGIGLPVSLPVAALVYGLRGPGKPVIPPAGPQDRAIAPGEGRARPEG